MSVTSALANQGFSKDSVTSGVMSGNPYLDGYQFRWVAGSRYAKSYTPGRLAMIAEIQKDVELYEEELRFLDRL